MRDPVPSLSPPATMQPWRLLTAATLVQVAVSVVGQGVPTLAPYIQADLGLSRGQVGLFPSMVNLGFLATVNLAGWAVDTLGDRLVLMLGLTVVSVTAFLVAQASHFLATLIGLLLIGGGAATITPAGSKVVMARFPGHLRGMAMGVRQTGIPLGGAIAAATLPFLAHTWNWRLSIAGAGTICLAGGFVAWLLLRTVPPSADDLPEQSRQRVSLRALLSRDVTLVCIACLLMAPSQFVLITYLALFLREGLGVPLAVGTLVLALCQITGAAARIGIGTVSDRLFRGRRSPALVLAGGVGCLSALLLALSGPATPIWAAILMALAFGTASLSWHGLHITLASELSAPGRQGRTVAITMTALFTGIVLGPPLFGYLVDLSGSYRIGWGAVAALMGAGAAVFAMVREPQRGPAT